METDPVEKWAILVPPAMQPRVIVLFHETRELSHLGARKTLQLMKKRFKWPKMADDVNEHIRSCHVCQIYKAGKGSKPVPLQPKLVKAPNQLVSIDIATIDKNGSRYKYVLTIVDCFTGFSVVIPLKTMKEKETLETFVKDWIVPYGAPVRLTSDNGSQFVYRAFTNMLKKYDIRYGNTTIYHPQTNANAERVHRWLKDRLDILAKTKPGHW